MAHRLHDKPESNRHAWLQPLLGVMVLASLASLTGCGYLSSRQAYATARVALDAEVDALPLPPGSKLLARRDGISTGHVEPCVCVTTELLLGNGLPAPDVYRFYRDVLTAQGWEVKLEIADGAVLVRERAGLEVSDLYYTSAVTDHAKIRSFESQYESLALVGMAYTVFDPKVCDEAVKKEETRVKRLLDKR